MNTSKSLLFGCLIFFLTVTNVWSLKCYSCALCNDPFKKSEATIVDCTGSCIKGKTSDIVARSCSPFSGGDRCDEGNGAHACSCTSDLCNSASGISVSFFVVCLSAIAMILRM